MTCRIFDWQAFFLKHRYIEFMYETFSSFLVRTPRSLFNHLYNESFETKIRDSYLQETIYVASTDLFYELQKNKRQL